MRALFFILLCSLLSACISLPSPDERRLKANELAEQNQWQSRLLQTNKYTLQSYVRPKRSSPSLTIYIEGDGFAWRTANMPSTDPTPINPLALKLALADTTDNKNVAYLARPCQYTTGDNRRNCQTRNWTQGRFSQVMVDASSQAVDQLKSFYDASSITLVGFSGGGAIATLVAAQRDDVTRLITVAGNIDHQRWTELHNLSPLDESLNPPHYWKKLLNIPQLHLVGGADRNISSEIALSYRRHFPTSQQPQIKLIPGFEHHCCWLEQWPELIEQ